MDDDLTGDGQAGGQQQCHHHRPTGRYRQQRPAATQQQRGKNRPPARHRQAVQAQTRGGKLHRRAAKQVAAGYQAGAAYQ